MAKPFLKFQQVNFTYETAVEPLFQDISVHLPSGWAGIVGANGAGKTTFLKLATGLLTPNAGMVQTPAKSVYCQPMINRSILRPCCMRLRKRLR